MKKVQGLTTKQKRSLEAFLRDSGGFNKRWSVAAASVVHRWMLSQCFSLSGGAQSKHESAGRDHIVGTKKNSKFIKILRRLKDGTVKKITHRAGRGVQPF